MQLVLSSTWLQTILISIIFLYISYKQYSGEIDSAVTNDSIAATPTGQADARTKQGRKKGRKILFSAKKRQRATTSKGEYVY